jgi:hypothetical protein
MANKRINKKIRKEALEQLNKLKQSNQVSNRSYEAIKNTIEESRIDVVKRLQQNFNVLEKTKSTEKITKGSLKEVVEKIKETKRNVIAKLAPSIKKRFLDISQINDFNINRKPLTIKGITGVKLQRILRNLDTRKGVLLQAGSKNYVLKPHTVKDLIKKVDAFFVDEEQLAGSDKEILQEIMNLKQIVLMPFNKKKDTNQGGFFKYYNKTTIDLKDFQIYNNEPDKYDENCFVYALMKSELLTETEINSIKFMCAGIYVPCNKIKEICDKYNLTIRVKINTTDHHVKKYGNGERIVNIGLIDKHYFAIKTIPYSLYSIKNYEELKDKKDWHKINDSTGKKRDNRYTDSFKAIQYMFENKETYFEEMPYSDMLNTQYANEVNDITNLEYEDDDVDDGTKWNKKYVKKINGNMITYKSFGMSKTEKFELVFFDFETITEGEKHIPYLVCNSSTNETYYGENCGKEMLHCLVNKLCYGDDPVKVIILMAHNAGYDYRFIIDYLVMDTEITSGKKLLESVGRFYYGKGKYVRIVIKDSYSLCGLSLAKWGEAMKVPSEKEIMPYGLYTSENVSDEYIDKSICKLACMNEYKKKKYCEGIKATDEEALTFYNKFLENAIKWKCVRSKGSAPPNSECETVFAIDIVEYSNKYCEIDIKVLQECYTKMREICLHTFDIDILDCMSSSQLAQNYMKVKDVFEGVYSISAVPREFIMKCIEGGRVMCANNEKNSIELEVADFDAVSLYPSAMDRLGGYLIGQPEIIGYDSMTGDTTGELSYDFLRTCDGYFVEIIVKTIQTKREFSLLSSKDDDEGIRIFDNELPKRMFVCKQKLEDLIEYQGITFDVIRGYCFNQGRNYKLRDVINYIFKERKRLKAEGNPLQEVYKLIMNGAYGKTLQGAYDEQINFIYGEDKLEKYVSKNYNTIDYYTEFGDNEKYKKYRLKMIKPIKQVFNYAHCGVEILGMSKRIMNEVMCLAEDNKMKIYYQDTDSMHIEDKNIDPLSKLYKEKYNKELIGKNMGQFHSDFASDIIKKDIIAVKSIFLGKKAYIDVLQGKDEEGKLVQDFHIRMKGVSEKAIRYYCFVNDLDPYELYKKLHKNETIDFDLTCGGNACSFEYNSNYTITSKSQFIRSVNFKNK